MRQPRAAPFRNRRIGYVGWEITVDLFDMPKYNRNQVHKISLQCDQLVLTYAECAVVNPNPYSLDAHLPIDFVASHFIASPQLARCNIPKTTRTTTTTMASRSDTELLTEHFGYPPVVCLSHTRPFPLFHSLSSPPLLLSPSSLP